MRFILMFHHLGPGGSALSFPPEGLPRLLDGLDAAGVPVLDLDELLDARCERGVALTFDDGFRSIAELARPVLQERGLPAHLFLTTRHVGGDNRWPSQPPGTEILAFVTWRDVEVLHASGWRIEAHTHTHPDLRTLPLEAAATDCARADEEIERRLGRRPRYFAYPYGALTGDLENLLAQRYAAMLTTEFRPLDRRRDRRTALPRLDAFYFRQAWLQRRPASYAGRTYLALRGRIRVWRGR